MIHYCEHCDFKSNHRWVVRRHADTKHSHAQHKSYSNNKIPVIVNQSLPTQVGYVALTSYVQTESNDNNTVTTED